MSSPGCLSDVKARRHVRRGVPVALALLASVAFAAAGLGGTVHAISSTTLNVGQAVAKPVVITWNGQKSNARIRYVQVTVRITSANDSDRATLKELWSTGNQVICRSTIAGDPSWSSDPKNSKRANPHGALIRGPDRSFSSVTAYCAFPTDRDQGGLMRGTVSVLEKSREHRRSFALRLSGTKVSKPTQQPQPPPNKLASPSCSGAVDGPLGKQYRMGSNERMKVFVVDQFGCVLFVKDYCAIRTAQYDAGRGDVFTTRECPPDDEVGHYRVYPGDLPMNSSAFPNSAANLSLNVLRIGAAGYAASSQNQVSGRCSTSQKFPVTFSSRGRKFIRYRCA